MAPLVEKHLSKDDPLPPLEKGKLRLYGNQLCPYVQRTRLLLALKDIPFETVYIQLHSKPDWYASQINPLSKVPVIQKDDTIVFDSVIIHDYVDAVFPGEKFTDSDPYQLAVDRMVLERWNKVVMPFYKLFATKGQNKDIIPEFFEGLDVIEAELVKRGTPFFGGQGPKMLDIMMWPHSERIGFYQTYSPDLVLDDKRFKLFKKWLENMTSHPAVKKTSTNADVFKKFMTAAVDKDFSTFYEQ